KLLNDGTEVFDLVVATGNVLAHFVNYPNEGLPGATTSDKLETPLDHLGQRDRSISTSLRLCPRICRGIRVRFDLDELRTRPGNPLGTFADHLPFLLVQLLAGLDEFIELAFGLQFDLKLGDVEVLGVVQVPQQDDVQELRNPLCHSPGVL